MTHVRAATEATGATSAVDGAAAGAGDDDAAAEADCWLAIPFFRRCNHGGRGQRRWGRPSVQRRPGSCYATESWDPAATCARALMPAHSKMLRCACETKKKG